MDSDTSETDPLLLTTKSEPDVEMKEPVVEMSWSMTGSSPEVDPFQDVPDMGSDALVKEEGTEEEECAVVTCIDKLEVDPLQDESVAKAENQFPVIKEETAVKGEEECAMFTSFMVTNDNQSDVFPFFLKEEVVKTEGTAPLKCEMECEYEQNVPNNVDGARTDEHDTTEDEQQICIEDVMDGFYNMIKQSQTNMALSDSDAFASILKQELAKTATEDTLSLKCEMECEYQQNVPNNVDNSRTDEHGTTEDEQQICIEDVMDGFYNVIKQSQTNMALSDVSNIANDTTETSSLIRNDSNTNTRSVNTILGSDKGLNEYLCHLCSKYFSFFNLIEHMLKHNIMKLYKCAVCDCRFYSHVNLNQRLLVQTLVKNYLCHICGSTFYYDSNLTKHLLEHDKYAHCIDTDPHKCQIYCEEFIGSNINGQSSQYGYDKLQIHNPCKRETKCFTCECGRRFIYCPCDREMKFFNCECGKMSVHCPSHDKISTHNEGETYKCGFCDSQFADIYESYYHISGQCFSAFFKCGICGTKFAKSNQLKKHILAMHIIVSIATQPFRCLSCHQSLPENQLTMHSLIHALTPYKCLVCYKEFSKRCLLEMHVPICGREMSYILGGDTTKYKCILCREQFSESFVPTEYVYVITAVRSYKYDTQFSEGFKLCEHVQNDMISSISDRRFIDFHTGSELNTRVFIQIIDKFYTCNKCDKEFSEGSLFHHVLSHDAVQLKCHSCKTEFFENSQLEMHISKDHSQNICALCLTNFPNKYQLTKHFSQAHTVMSYSCTSCSEIFSEHFKFIAHISAKHTREPDKCDSCGMKISNIHQLRKHFSKFHTLTLYKCASCSEVFSKHFKLVAHVSDKHIQESNKCGVCGRNFSNKNQITKHFSLLHTVKSYKCNSCGKIFSGDVELVSHVSATHTRVSYKCGLCSIQFSECCNLGRHISINHTSSKPYRCYLCEEQRSESYKCNLCNAEFSENSQLQLHTSTKHAEKPLKCEKCEKQLIGDVRLQLHYLTIHALVSYKCSVCEHQVTDDHLYAHSPVCVLCKKQFTKHPKLIAHVHSHKRVLQCVVCSTECSDNVTLINHLLFHINAKPHPYSSRAANNNI